MSTRERAPVNREWRRSLSSETDLGLIRAVIDEVVLADELDAEKSFHGLAACELLARFRGDCRLRASIPERVFETAVRAVDRLAEGSRVALELWFATPESSAWRRGLDELRARLVRA